MVILTSCKTNNTIENKSYNVDININDINEAFVPASNKAMEAVVGVSLYTKDGFIRSWALTATGSGVIYKGSAFMKDGTTKEIRETSDSSDVDYYEYYLLTNAHVVNSNAENKEIKVYLSKIDTLVTGSIVGINAYVDLAVVKFTTSIYLMPLSFTSSEVKTGEVILAVGNPLGYEYERTVTMGIISNTNRFIEVSRDINGDGKDDWEGTVEVIQHDAAINSGNSGGALVNIKGELVGINAMKITDKNETIEGIGFAIPIPVVSSVLEQMEKGEAAKANLLTKATIYNVNEIINRDVLNLKHIPLVDLSGYEYTYGAYIYKNDSLSYGLKNDDIVIKMNDNDIYNKEMLEALLLCYNEEKITWKVYRDGEIQEIEYIFK